MNNVYRWWWTVTSVGNVQQLYLLLDCAFEEFLSTHHVMTTVYCLLFPVILISTLEKSSLGIFFSESQAEMVDHFHFPAKVWSLKVLMVVRSALKM